MKNYIQTVAAVLSLVALGLIASSCADTRSTGTHEMGPPGKGRLMSDEEMPTRAR